MKTKIEFNSINDGAKFMEELVQETGIRVTVSLLFEGTWLLVVSGTSAEHCRRCVVRADVKALFL